MVLASSRSGLFSFRRLLAPENCLEYVQQIIDFWGNCLNFWLFIKKGVYLFTSKPDKICTLNSIDSFLYIFVFLYLKLFFCLLVNFL